MVKDSTIDDLVAVLRDIDAVEQSLPPVRKGRKPTKRLTRSERADLVHKRFTEGKPCSNCGTFVLNEGAHKRSLICISTTKRKELIDAQYGVWTERAKNERLWQILHEVGVLRFEATRHKAGFGPKARAKLEVERWCPLWAGELILDLARLKLPRADITLLMRAAKDENSRVLILLDPVASLLMLKGARGR